MGLMDWVRPDRERAASTTAGAGDLACQAHSQLVHKLGAAGVPAAAVIDALRPTDQADIGGGQRVEVGVTITPTGGQPYRTIITQSFLPSQMEGLSPGTTVSVTYDPDEPTAALISAW